MKTALQVLSQLPSIPSVVTEAARYAKHPQERTEVFHEIFNAPIREARPQPGFPHMDDQRVAFRAAFILSEAIELLEKGLGLEVRLGFKGTDEPHDSWHGAKGSSNGPLTSAILAAMVDQGTSDFRNLVEVVDALGDLNVVVNGFAVELGMDMRVVDAEVFASNMTKLDEAGNPIVSDGTDGHPKGKIIKGPNFVEPQIAAALGLDQ